ncbi:MAG: protein translocase subunit SecD, partial [Acidimicrobiales bacterium]
IVVQLPGVKDRAKALAIIGQTAQLQFRPVLCAAPAFIAPAPGAKTPPAGPITATTCSPSALQGTISGGQAAASKTGGAPAVDAALASVPTTAATADNPKSYVILPDISNGKVANPNRLVLGPAQANGSIIAGATAQLDQAGTQWQINFTTTGSGSKILSQVSTADLHKFLAIDLDGQIQSAPVINGVLSSQAQITGSFTHAQASNLALVLRYGSLPVQFNQLSVSSVSPTLGKASLHAGLVAGLVGLALVMLYMIFYYRALGIVVVLGLATTAALLWAIISYLGHSNGLALDLSGVTGLIVSVGVTVDSYVVYFERLKDDLRSGRTIRSSTERGFSRALRTIVAADLVSLIGAVLLYLLAVGAVRGFAFMLGLSTLLDLITAYVFTRPMVVWLGRHKTFTEARWLGVARGLAVRTGSPA